MEKQIWKWFAVTCGLSVIALTVTFMQKPLPDIKPAHINVLGDPTPPRLALGAEKQPEKEQTQQDEKPSLNYTEYIKKGDELALLGEFDQFKLIAINIQNSVSHSRKSRIDPKHPHTQILPLKPRTARARRKILDLAFRKFQRFTKD